MENCKIMTVEQICFLCNIPQYKETRGIRYNWKYSGEIVDNINFSISDLHISGKSLNQLNLIIKIFICIFKRIFISLEIGEFRNTIIEKILDSSLGYDFDICALIRPNMKWIEAKSDKIDYIRQITIKFVTDAKNQVLFFNIIEITDENERKKFMEKLIEKINHVFDNKIADLMKNVILTNENDYNLYIKTNKPFLTEHIEKHQLEGNLTDGLICCRKEEELNDR